MAFWPNLSAFNAEIYKTLSPDGVIDGVAIIFDSADNRSYGMRLMKSGFRLVASDTSRVVYRKQGKLSFSKQDLLLWFPTPSNTHAMIAVEHHPSVMGNGSSLLKGIDDSNNSFAWDGGEDTDEHAFRPGISQKTEQTSAALSSVIKERRPFGVSHDGVAWVSRALTRGMDEDDLQEKIVAAVSDWRNHRYGLPEDKLISKSGADSIAKRAVKDKANLLEICRWAYHRFGAQGQESVKILVDSIRKQKDGKGDLLLKDYRTGIEQLLKHAIPKSDKPLISGEATGISPSL